MKILLLILSFSASVVFAQDNTIQFEEELLKGRPVTLNAQEKEALRIARLWRSSKDAHKPIVGDNGSVTYFYGKSQPVMICAPLEICVVRLEVGEAITHLDAGDTVRWKITPTIVGHEGQQRTEVVVKPVLTGLVSSLYIGTTRRSYNIKLKSTRTEFIPSMEFIYPETIQSALAKYRKKADKVYSSNQLEVAKVDNQKSGEALQYQKRHVSDLDFNYEIKGNTDFNPLRVYNDGIRTIIQMDKSINNTDLPVLLVLDAKNQQNVVNYRVKENRFIVDQVFKKAILIAGVGKYQQKVTITRGDN